VYWIQKKPICRRTQWTERMLSESKLLWSNQLSPDFSSFGPKISPQHKKPHSKNWEDAEYKNFTTQMTSHSVNSLPTTFIPDVTCLMCRTVSVAIMEPKNQPWYCQTTGLKSPILGGAYFRWKSICFLEFLLKNIRQNLGAKANWNFRLNSKKITPLGLSTADQK